MANALTEYQERLHHLMRTDPGPRVRHREHDLLLVAEGQTVAPLPVLLNGASRPRLLSW